MLKKFFKFLGFGEEENDEYNNEFGRRKRASAAARDETMRGSAYDDYDDGEEHTPPLKNGLILFKGLPSPEDKLQLRKALLNGCIILLDLSGIPPERIEEGKQFLTFMQGVSFFNECEFIKLAPRLFSVTPQPDMVQIITGTNTSKPQGEGV
jgi:FtsZ-interacting cell division protein YlmF